MFPILALALLPQKPDDGKLVTDAPGFSTALPPYEAFVARRKARMDEEAAMAKAEGRTFAIPPISGIVPSREEYAETTKLLAKVVCRKLTYWSDGLKVTAYLWKPPVKAEAKLPLVIYNRGGNQSFGMMVPMVGFMLAEYLKAGYAVLASQYRGVDGGEGKEEFGGADVDDVMSLFPLARGLGFLDMANVSMLGDSRGGMMTYLALKRGAPVNAAAVRSGPTDLRAGLKLRPDGAALYEELIPGYKDHPEASLSERSAVDWPEKIDAPVFLIHGTADWRVDPADTLRLAQGLQAKGKRYAVAVYEGDNHGLNSNAADVDRRIVAWFRRFAR